MSFYKIVFDISFLSVDLLEPLTTIKSVDLSYCNLSQLQIDKLLKSIETYCRDYGSEPKKIAELSLAGNDLSETCVELLSKCIRCLKGVNLGHTNLSMKQRSAILQDIMEDEHFQMESLDFSASKGNMEYDEELIETFKYQVKNLKL